jgi:glycosyltransferase involved in cell wall biosynthesis
VRILHVISSLGLGGAENVAIELARQFADRHQVHVFALRQANPRENLIAAERRTMLEAHAIAWSEGRAGSQRLAPLLAPFELIRLINQIRPDIVHSHTDVPDFCLALASRFTRFKIARTIHNTQLWPTRRSMGRIAEAHFRDDLVVAINQPTLQAYRDLRRSFGLSSSPSTTIIPNGVRQLGDDEYHDAQHARDVLGADPERLQVAFIGRLDPQKGFDTLLASLDLLSPPARARLQMHVLGEGVLAEAAARAAASGLITWRGARPDARRWLKTFALVVMPSRFEGAPLVAAEALMAGAPVLISDIPGLREAAPSGWPLIVPAGDPGALASLLEALVMGRETLPAVPPGAASQFDAARMGSAYLEAYERHLEAGAQPELSPGTSKRAMTAS